MGFEDPFPVLTRDTGPEELGVSLSIALLDSVGVILVVGVCDSLPVGVVEDLPVLGNVEDVFGSKASLANGVVALLIPMSQ